MIPVRIQFDFCRLGNPHIEVLDREGMIILSHLYINWKEVDQKESPVELLIVLVINMEDLI